MERPFFFAGAVPNVTGAFAPVRYADRATKTKEIRAMTMPTVPYNGTASTPRIIDQPVSGMVGPYRVHTAPAPPPKGKGHSTFGHYKRPNADPARRGAYGSLKKAGMLPVIKPDDIGRSQTSQGAPLQRGIFGSVYDSIVGALEPMATIVEEGPAESTRAERVPAQPAAPPPAPRKTMAELWDFIAGNFMCEHGPDQPCLRSSADLGGKLILISNVHAELVGMGQIKDLLRRFMRDGDVFLAERDPRYVGPEMVPFGPCFGVPQERCIPIDLPGLSDKLTPLHRSANLAAYERLALLAPEKAEAIFETSANPAQELHALKIATEELRPTASPSQRAKLRKLDRAFNAAEAMLVEQVDALRTKRDANFASQIGKFWQEAKARGGTVYCSLGVAHLWNLRGMFTGPQVLQMIPITSFANILQYE